VLDEELATAPARHERPAVAGDDGEGKEPLRPGGDDVRDEPALGAQRQAVGGVLDVATDEDPAVGDEAGRADAQSRVGRVGVARGPRRLGAQVWPVDLDPVTCVLRRHQVGHYTSGRVIVAAGRQFRVGDHVRQALADGRGVVALETTLIAHGLPSPDNLEVARQLEQDVRDQGAEAATVGVIAGVPIVGLSPAEVERLADPKAAVTKLSARDLGLAIAGGVDGATTVAGTITLAARAGIAVMATGGIGGVHRGAVTAWDVSADLETMRVVPVLVVSSGVKSILDIAATLERLESLGVPVVGYRTKQFPGFYVSATRHRLDWSVESPEEAANAFAAHRDVSGSGMLLANPVDPAHELDPARHDAALSEALELAEVAQLSGKEVTPFLLAHLAEATQGESVRVNRAVVRGNATLAARVAVALAASGHAR